MPDTGYINKVLAALGRIERTSEQIRQMRKRAMYKELVQELKLAREHMDQNLSVIRPATIFVRYFEVVHEGRRQVSRVV